MYAPTRRGNKKQLVHAVATAESKQAALDELERDEIAKISYGSKFMIVLMCYFMLRELDAALALVGHVIIDALNVNLMHLIQHNTGPAHTHGVPNLGGNTLLLSTTNYVGTLTGTMIAANV